MNGAVFTFAIALGVIVYLTPLKEWLVQGDLIKSELASFGIAAPLVFTLSTAVLTVIGTPRLLLCSLAGLSFGFFWGVLWSLVGTLLGSYGIFLFIRKRGSEYALFHFPRLRRFSQELGSHGVMSVLLIRQLPMSGFYNTAFLGLTPVTHGDFLIGSLFGFLPLGITACLIGAGLLQADIMRGVQYMAIAMASSLILGLLLKRLALRRSNA